MMARSDGIVLGHVQLRDDWSLTVNEEERTRVVENTIEEFVDIGPPLPGSSNTGVGQITTAISPLPLEAFFGRES